MRVSLGCLTAYRTCSMVFLFLVTTCLRQDWVSRTRVKGMYIPKRVKRPNLHDYNDKPQYARRKHSWSSNANLAFIGENIINCLHHLGKQHKQQRGHCLQHQDDHPQGPGAVSFYNVFGVGWKYILKDVQKVMPVKFCCGTRVLCARLARHFLNAKFVH